MINFLKKDGCRMDDYPRYLLGASLGLFGGALLMFSALRQFVWAATHQAIMTTLGRFFYAFLLFLGAGILAYFGARLISRIFFGYPLQ
jgi:hypothetical protein